MSKKTVLALVVAAGLLASCSKTPPPDSIVLVIIDTCRADRLGNATGEYAMTPSLDEFADSAATFTSTYSQSPWTLPSVASIFTSQIPSHHGAGGRLGDFRSLPAEAVTLAEVCRAAGMATATVANVQFLTDRFGMTQGYDHVDDFIPSSNLKMRRATPTTDAALEWLAEHGERPFLLVVHYFDPHLVYDPPQPYRRRFAEPEDRESEQPRFGMFGQMQRLRRGEYELSPDVYVRLGGLYDGEVSYSDSEFGRLVRGLDAAGLNDRAVVAVMSDHGEEFNEHGGFEHGHTLYDELLHVPLLIRVPDLSEEGRRIPDTVALIDVAPTLCELIDVPASPAFEGLSLVPALLGERLPERAIVSQGNMWGPEQVCLRQGDWKVIVETVPGDTEGTVGQQFKLFDLEADPGEHKNLVSSQPGRLAAMLQELGALLAAEPVRGKAPELSEEERKRLRSLGYVR